MRTLVQGRRWCTSGTGHVTLVLQFIAVPFWPWRLHYGQGGSRLQSRPGDLSFAWAADVEVDFAGDFVATFFV